MNVKGKRIIAALLAGALLLNNSSFYSLAAEISENPETGYAGEVVDEPEEKEETEESTTGVEITDDVSTEEDNNKTDIDNASGNLADDSGDKETKVDNGSMIVDDQMNVSEDIAETSENMQETVPETIAEGSCGENLTWTLDKNGLLKIEGTGSMVNYKSGTAPWVNHKESVLKLKIDDGVGTIGSYAFYGCNNLTGGLELPEGLQTIGEYAFCSCNKLEGDLNIPDSVTSIGTYAFYGCSGFKGTLKL
ncbi:MAG: leucine-rich repeat domain-containing protein, partial [Dorea sp.]|nr:leucine-rich repeat domain-containing protein [Dorea sp.]